MGLYAGGAPGTDIARDLENKAYDALDWATGRNNLEAIKDVWNDKYYYNDSDDVTPLKKIKQIAVEALHVSLKYSTMALAFDKITGKEIFTNLPFPAQLYIPGSMSNIIYTAHTALGFAALAYNAQIALKSFSEAQKSFSKIVEKDYDNNVNLSISNLIGTAENIATVFPIYHFAMNYGLLNGSLYASPFLYASNHYDSLNTPVAKAIKTFVVVYTASHTPVAPIARVAARIATTLTDLSARMFGF